LEGPKFYPATVSYRSWLAIEARTTALISEVGRTRLLRVGPKP